MDNHFRGYLAKNGFTGNVKKENGIEIGYDLSRRDSIKVENISDFRNSKDK